MGTLTLHKAVLTTASTQGWDKLLPYDLETALYEELVTLQPLLQLLPMTQAGGKTHEYSLRTAHPQGWFEGETTPSNYKQGTYTRKSVQLKIARIWGSVSGFAQEMDEAFVDALATELDGSLQGMADLFEYMALFSTSNDIWTMGDAYQSTGLLPIIYKNAPATVIAGGAAKVTLDMLDQCIAAGRQYRQLQNDPYLWLMSVRMKQVVDGLQTKVQLPLQTVQLPDGKIEMAAYGRAPILETNYLVPGNTSPACTTALASGGSLPDATQFNYRIASVTMYGECIGGTAGTARTTGTPNFKITLTWTADANALAYMIFRQQGGSGNFSLLAIIPAKTYDGDGTVNGTVATWSDDGTFGTPVSQVIPQETGHEMIIMLNRHPVRGLQFLGKIDDMGRPVENMLRYVELARVKDTYDYMLKTYLTMLARYANVHAVIRNVKLS